MLSLGSLMLSWKVCALACDSCGNECSSGIKTKFKLTKIICIKFSNSVRNTSL